MDIFIKTYHRDFVWLQYCLKSIKKFASGFRNIVIVSDNDGHGIPKESLLPNCKVFYVNKPLKRFATPTPQLGYLWQQYIKLTWYNYTDAETILVLDSDEMLTVPVTPESFKRDNKFVWYYREWSKAGSAIFWKKSTDFIHGLDTKYEAMCVTGFILQKETTLALTNHLCSKHGVNNLWDMFMKYNMETASEYNIFGSFVYHYDRKEYLHVLDHGPENSINYTILKSWSWGGLQDEDKKKRETILT
jgi:hypothetical protein